MERHGGGEGCERGGREKCGMSGGDYYNIHAENCWMGDKSCKMECEEEEECDGDSKCGGKEKEECMMKKDTVVKIEKKK